MAIYRSGPQQGKLVTVGTGRGGYPGPFMARFDASGRLDSSFGVNGIVDDLANIVGDVELLDDGSVLVISEDQIEHYRADGSYLNTIELPGVADIQLDRTGDDAGTVLYARYADATPRLRVGRVSVNGDPIWERMLSLKEDPDAAEPDWSDEGAKVIESPNGSVTVVGTHRFYFSIWQTIGKLSVVRLFADGRFDQRFGVGGGVGHRITDQLGSASAHLNVSGAAFDSRGRLLLSTAGAGPAADWSAPVIVRLTEGGALDASFSDDGIVHPLFNAALFDIAEDAKGRVISGGIVESHDTAGRDAGVIRLLDDGARDPDFGQDGVASVAPTPFPSANTAYAMDFDPAGIVIAGRTGVYPGHTDFQGSLTRFLAEPTSDDDGGGSGGVAGEVSSKGRGLQVHRLVSARTWRKLVQTGIRALVSCEQDCRALLEVKVPKGAAEEMGLGSRVVARGSRVLAAGKRRWVIAKLTSQARRALRTYTGGGRFKVTARGVAP